MTDAKNERWRRWAGRNGDPRKRGGVGASLAEPVLKSRPHAHGHIAENGGDGIVRLHYSMEICVKLKQVTWKVGIPKKGAWIAGHVDYLGKGEVTRGLICPSRILSSKRDRLTHTTIRLLFCLSRIWASRGHRLLS